MPMLRPAGPNGVSSLICVRVGAASGSAASAVLLLITTTNIKQIPSKDFHDIRVSKKTAHPERFRMRVKNAMRGRELAARGHRRSLELLEKVHDFSALFLRVVNGYLVAFLGEVAGAEHHAVIRLHHSCRAQLVGFLSAALGLD